MMTENIGSYGSTRDENSEDRPLLISISEKRKLRKKKSAKSESYQNKVPNAEHQEFPGQDYDETEDFSKFNRYQRDKTETQHDGNEFSLGPSNHDTADTKTNDEYQRRKTYGQAFLDFALFIDNASLLKKVIVGGFPDPISYILLALLIINILLQIFVGAGLALRDEKCGISKACKVNDRIVIGTFLIFAINYLIVAFRD